MKCNVWGRLAQIVMLGAISTACSAGFQSSQPVVPTLAAAGNGNVVLALSAASGWTNIPLDPSQFTVSFDVSPTMSAEDTVVGLSANQASAYTDVAAAIRFYTNGVIEARNGGTYSALTSIPYVAGQLFHIDMSVNLTKHTYSVVVKPNGKASVQLVKDAAFRTEQNAVSGLNYLASFGNPGGANISNLAISFATSSPSPSPSPSPAPSPAPAPAPQPQPAPIPAPAPSPSPSASLIPLSFDDARYSGNTKSSMGRIFSGGTVASNLTWDGPNTSFAVGTGNFTLKNSRIRSNEGIRAGGGNITLDQVIVEVDLSDPEDHADGFQAYGPGSTGTISVSNSTFHAFDAVGYFAADNFKGDHYFNNVLFWGGNFGVRIACDGGKNVGFNGVYFVKGSFSYEGYFLNDGSCPSTQNVTLTEWTNVHSVTIVNNQIVVGPELPPPCKVPCTIPRGAGGGN